MAWFLFEAMQADDEEDEEVKIPMDVDVDEIVEDDLDAEVDEIHNHTTSDKTKKVYSCVASNFPSSPDPNKCNSFSSCTSVTVKRFLLSSFKLLMRLTRVAFTHLSRKLLRKGSRRHQFCSRACKLDMSLDSWCR